MAWTYSDWVTKATGSAERLSRLRLHLQEVTDQIGASYSLPGISMSKGELVAYADRLKADEAVEAAAVERATGTRVGWTRGRATL